MVRLRLVDERIRAAVRLRDALVSGNNSVVECDLAKVEVAGSNPVSRSILVTSCSATSADLPASAWLVGWRPARRLARAVAAPSAAVARPIRVPPMRSTGLDRTGPPL